jgi:hypothetical protein
VKLIIQSIVGGVSVMAVLALILTTVGGGLAFVLLLWPIFIFRPYFPPPPDSLMPGIPSGTGLIVSLLFATFVYSLLIYLGLRLAKGRRLP